MMFIGFNNGFCSGFIIIGIMQFNGYFSSCVLYYIYVMFIELLSQFITICYSLITNIKGYSFVIEKTFGYQKRFDCIPKLFVSHYPIWVNFGKVVLFRLLLRFLQIFLCFLKVKKFSRDGHFLYLFLSLYLFTIALLSSFVIKSASLPLTIFSLLEHVYQELF